MVKKILKILYISFGLLFAILIYMVGYQSNLSSHILNLTAEAIESKDYSNIALVHGGCFDRENLIVDDSDELEIGIYSAAHLSAFNVYDNKDAESATTKRFYDNAYIIYVVAPKFSIKGYSENGKMVNQSGINLFDGDKSYKYDFLINDEINKDKYISKPVSTDEAYFIKRDLITYYDTWDFMNIVITQGMLKAMGLNKITKLEFVNDVNEVVETFDINLDFSQKFFADVKPLSENYNNYIQKVEASNNDSKVQKEAEEEFNKFYEGESGFHNSFLAMDDSYSYRYTDKELEPGKIVWQTIGMLSLYLLAAVGLYLLFFHFNDIKNLFTRNRGNYRVNPASVNAAKANAINAKAKDVTKPEINVKNEVKEQDSTDEVKE